MHHSELVVCSLLIPQVKNSVDRLVIARYNSTTGRTTMRSDDTPIT